jgi:hypothetical protein
MITNGEASHRDAVLPENHTPQHIYEASSRPEARHWRILQWPRGLPQGHWMPFPTARQGGESTMATRTSTPRAWAMRLSVSIVGFA